VKAISEAVGNGKVYSLADGNSVAFPSKEHQDIFRVNLDMKPSELLLGTEEAPADFEWFSERGLVQNAKKVLTEFTKKFNLRPIKIISNTVYNEKERAGKYRTTLEE
jgi:hypothetical protein